jgi:hypothetical protein
VDRDGRWSGAAQSFTAGDEVSGNGEMHLALYAFQRSVTNTELLAREIASISQKAKTFCIGVKAELDLRQNPQLPVSETFNAWCQGLFEGVNLWQSLIASKLLRDLY